MNNYEGSIPFTRSIDSRGFSQQCSKSAVISTPRLFLFRCVLLRAFVFMCADSGEETNTMSGSENCPLALCVRQLSLAPCPT